MEKTDRISALYEKAGLLPLVPGVYLMKNAAGKVIYVGKYKALKNRVSSYFAPYADHGIKTAKMVSNVADFEVYCTATEIEALVLENELIKKYQPKYNIKLKDSRSYPYIRVSSGEYPSFTVTRKKDDPKIRYFGPYSGTGVAYGILETARKTFSLPDCKKKFPAEIDRRARPSLNYHIGLCCGVCIGAVRAEEYNELCRGAVRFLCGDYSELEKDLESRMKICSENMQYEKAAKYRDRLKAVRKTGEKQFIVASPDTEADVVGVYSDDLGGAVNILFVRSGIISDKETFYFSNDEIINSASVCSFLQGFYQVREFIPSEIWMDIEPDAEDASALSEWLGSQGKTKLVFPKKGEKKKLTERSAVNAKELTILKRKEEEHQNGFLISLAEFLQLPMLPERIEAYDISNSGDDSITAGMIVIEDGKFCKKKYRSFNISSDRADDYGALREALRRRIAHADDGADASGDSPWALPDLFLMDGGKQHVSTAKEVLGENGIDIPVLGMVKDEYHKTRTLTDGENEISLVKRQDVFTFIYKIQEEVHRYALSRMDTRRRKTVKKSILTEIKGVGEKKALLLLQTFGGLKGLKAASVDEIEKVKGIDRELAVRIAERVKDRK
ncbi:MAG: excinuclease ABC subunit UvrC [Clostridia bacterium]|nr:excinuclease ABC subunit UvrC [Clostridia bacterium]